MSRRARILGASLVLEHVPDLVRYGSKPDRERARFAAIRGKLRTYEEAVAYAPNQVFIGNLRPETLWTMERPWWASRANGASSRGPHGEIMGQSDFYDLLGQVDLFGLVRLGENAVEKNGDIPLYLGDETVGAVSRAHDTDSSLTAHVLLENLSCKAGAVHALRHLLEVTDIDPDRVTYAIGCGEEAVGDRYNRGGGAMAKAVAEFCGLRRANGSDVKAFCTAPVHALALAGALVEAGVHETVAVVAGGSLAKLGMKFKGSEQADVPLLEDVLAGMAVLVGCRSDGPVLRTDALGQHPAGAESSQESLLREVVLRPLETLDRRLDSIDRYATELHNPEITEPAGGYDVPLRNYRLLAALGVVDGQLARSDIDKFCREHGLPGFSPTQGHIASAVPWLPHALTRFEQGEMSSTMLIAKGSLFLGRMTQMWDAVSLVLEV